MFKALEKKIIEKSSQTYQAKTLSFEGLLAATAWIYRSGAVIRNRFYQSGVLAVKKLPCPVISVGNITAGGTGKTPMAVFLADLLTRLGKKPVVISRGYRARNKKRAAVVGDGRRVFLDPYMAGDEPYMMASLKRFPVVVGKDRYQAGCLALDRLSPDVVLLDDGFQHIRLHRDLDLLLMDHDHPVGNGLILPAGRLREPVAQALARPDAVILTRCPANRPAPPHPVSALAPALPLFYTRHHPFLAAVQPAGFPKEEQGLSQRGDPASLPDLKMFQDVSAVLFSGIADNRAFYGTVRDLGANILDHLEFEDHYWYKRSDFDRIQERARALKAQILVTTHKDWARIDPQIIWPLDLAVVGVQVVFEDDDKLQTLIKAWLDKGQVNISICQPQRTI
jgi:tetraacyldisaccharide 4'-kinase